MAGNHADGLLRSLVEQVGRLVQEVCVRRPVEAVLTDVVLCCQSGRQCVRVCMRRHACMERGVEHTDLQQRGSESWPSKASGQHRNVVVADLCEPDWDKEADTNARVPDMSRQHATAQEA